MHTHYRVRDNAALRCALVLVVVVTTGTLGFLWTESEWTVWRALYFTLITITTVGYGDEGVSETGQIVATVLLVGGIGTFTYSISTLVQLAMDRESARARKMISKVKSWSHHVIVCGYGRMGESICRQLTDGGKRCVVIEEDDERFRDAIDDGFVAIQGAASEDDVLAIAGIERANAVVAAVNSDADNMYIVVSARALNHDCSIVARAETQSASQKMEHAGATFVVLPHMMAGESAATAILNPRLARAMRSTVSSEHRLTLGEATVLEDSELVGQTVQGFGRQLGDLVFVAIDTASGELVMRPPGQQNFAAGDVLICAGRQEDIQAVRKAAAGVVANV